jgi:hypothetical protein
VPSPKPPAYWRTYRAARKASGRPHKGGGHKPHHKRSPETRLSRPIWGIDGEGFTDPSGKHRYSYLAAASEDDADAVRSTYRATGLGYLDIATFLLSLPSNALLVGFSLGYDFCKWVEELSPRAIWRLCHTDQWKTKARIKEGRRIPSRPKWVVQPLTPEKGGGQHRWQKVSTKIVVSRWESKAEKSSRRTVVWDLFKFFQCSFVKALARWEVGTAEERERVAAMKEKRGAFAGIDEQEQAYCNLECRLLARLARQLVTSHDDAGIPLRTYFGPGSTASVLLTSWGFEEKKAEPPPEMMPAVMSAFFAGRFENSRVGPVRGALEKWDLASAYPYAMTMLPCLHHGTWKLVRRNVQDKVERARAACVYWVQGETPPSACWGQLPYRTHEGNLIWPTEGGSGWAWREEWLEAYASRANVEPREAWILEGHCKCPPYPLRAGVVERYCQRLEWGKDGRGLAIKLGLNSCYGKTVQRVGSSRFRDYVTGGMITSFTRSLLASALFQLRDPWDAVEVATDSIVVRRGAFCPGRPEELGTGPMARAHKGAELGAWTSKPEDKWPKGAFFVRPGIRFRLDADEIQSTAARGMGVKVLHENRAAVLRAWEEGKDETTVQQPTLFAGATSSVRRLADESYVRDEKYGRWLLPTPRKLSFGATPKRESRARGGRLLPWHLSPGAPPSLPYGLAPLGEGAREGQELRIVEDEQPDREGLDVVGGI